MASTSRPLPLYLAAPRAVCPVCGHTSYSAGGMHPQCAVRQADLKRMQKVRGRPKSRNDSPKAADLSPWQRMCPRCREVAHVRKKLCTCGHKFSVGPRPGLT
jgi:hypothetical protein